MRLIIRILSPILVLLPIGVCAQNAALKTNLFYAAYTYTPNLGLEVGLGNRSTLDITGGFNRWNLKGSAEDNKKSTHWLGNIEYRYWFCQKFNGHFFGIHALGSQYNIGGHELPLLFGKGSKDYRHQGWGAGAGISYGYQFILGRHWNLELNIGAGYVYLDYDRYECSKCGDRVTSTHRNYFGPTKGGVSLMYVF